MLKTKCIQWINNRTGQSQTWFTIIWACIPLIREIKPESPPQQGLVPGNLDTSTKSREIALQSDQLLLIFYDTKIPKRECQGSDGENYSGKTDITNTQKFVKFISLKTTYAAMRVLYIYPIIHIFHDGFQLFHMWGLLSTRFLGRGRATL